MKHMLTIRHLILVAVSTGLALQCCGDALENIRQSLQRNGLREGYDRAKKRLVSIGVAECKITEPTRNAQFSSLRNALAKRAALDARRNLQYNLTVDAKGTDTVIETTADHSTRTLRNTMRLFAENTLFGCREIASAESWDAATGIYQIAIAVGWSRKSCQAVKGALDYSAALLRDERDDGTEFENYFRTNSVWSIIGGRSFVGEDGKRRFVGVASADVDGCSAIKMRSAMTKARLYARGALEFSLNVNSVATQVAIRYGRELDSADGNQALSWDTFSEEVVNKCHSIALMAHEVHSEFVTHPISGRKMYVSVYGVTAVNDD